MVLIILQEGLLILYQSQALYQTTYENMGQLGGLAYDNREIAFYD
tara:strand:- start:56 stop:190 length:135 start_codon:yes stop_codon:yes gene_type:complete